MKFHVLACDYDGTLASAGKISPRTMDALRRVRETGRRILLITGRQFDDLLEVCPQIDFFDLVIAENGAVLFDPAAKRVEELAQPPPAAFLAALTERNVPFAKGRIIVATVVPHETAVVEAIRRLGLELQIIFNKEAVMVLPSGISKQSGLRAALLRLGISAYDTIGIGDAENDHAFLRRVGLSVAPANAVPALAAEVDVVTRAANGAGVCEFVDGTLLGDPELLRAALMKRTVELGVTREGEAVRYPVFGPNLLITGSSGSGKSTLTGLFVERLVRDEYVICLHDPEGDHGTLAEQEGVVVLAVEPGAEEGRAEEVERLIRHRSTSVSIDLSALGREEKIRATARFFHALQRLRAETGAPHWVIVDEAHHVFPPEGGLAEEMFDFEWTGVCLITNEPQSLAPQVLGVARHVFSTSLEAVTDAIQLVARDELPEGSLELGEALSIALDGPPHARVKRFRVARRESSHKRHVKK
jgi:hypothetical protein